MGINPNILDTVKKAAADKDFLENLKKNPAKAIESVTGKDLPDEQVNEIVKAVTSKVKLDDITGLLGKIMK